MCIPGTQKKRKQIKWGKKTESRKKCRGEEKKPATSEWCTRLLTCSILCFSPGWWRSLMGVQWARGVGGYVIDVCSYRITRLITNPSLCFGQWGRWREKPSDASGNFQGHLYVQVCVPPWGFDKIVSEIRPRGCVILSPSRRSVIHTVMSRAGHWVALSVAIILLSKSISILDSSSILSLLSKISSRNAFSGFPHYNVACFLGVREITTNGWYTGQVDR